MIDPALETPSAPVAKQSASSGVGSFMSRFKPGGGLRGRLVGGFLWSLIGAVLSRGSLLIVGILLAKLLGKPEYGKFAILQSTIQMLAALSGGGLNLTATKHVAEFRFKEPAKAGGVICLCNRGALLLGSGLALFLGIFAPIIAQTLQAPELTLALRLSTPYILLCALNGVSVGILAGFEAFSTITRINAVEGFGNLLFVGAGAYCGGIEGAVVGLCCNALLIRLFMARAVRGHCADAAMQIHADGLPEWQRILWDFTLPGMLWSMMLLPVQYACSVILTRQPDGFSQLALLTVANHWYSSLLFLPSVAGQALMPPLSERHGAGDVRSMRKTVKYATLANAAVALCIGLVLALLHRPLLSLYGPEYHDASVPLLLSLATALVVSVQSPSSQFLIAIGRQRLSLLISFIWGLFCVSGCWALRFHGASGIAAGRLLAFSLTLFITCGFAGFILHRFKTPSNMGPA